MKTAGLNKNIRKQYTEISEVAHYLWERGWAESNAGNVSVNITDEFRSNKHIPKTNGSKLNKAFPYLAGNFFLITASGSRMRDVASDPYNNILLINVSNNGQEYRYCGISKEGYFSTPSCTPTSELSVHLAYQNFLKKTNSKNKAILHTHATELIALTHIKNYTNEKKINKLLWNMHPETKMFIPEGVGLVPLMTPGTWKIAESTVKSAKNHRVIIWEKHGCLATGESVRDAFDLIDIVAKAAEIYFLLKKETK